MDVDRLSFYPKLLDILDDISQSRFVAFDLELSGVPTKAQWIARKPGKQTLQDRYAETKAAAEKYQVLQIGLTCALEDEENGKFIYKPYNFDISPLIQDAGIDVERDIIFHSGAATFLYGVNFDFSKPFAIGIPYLTPTETAQAYQRYDLRQQKDAISDMQIKDTDLEALAMMGKTRMKVKRWLERKSPDYLNIGPEAFAQRADGDTTPLPELTRFQKRLIHQVVRTEFPKLSTFSKRNFVQVVHLDEKREARLQAERKSENYARIARHVGFRWVVEALLGNDISALDLKLCATHPNTGEPIAADMNEYKKRFQNACARMIGRPRIMVGHNCFLDLIYLYHTFVGELPKTVDEFAKILSKRWNMIVDTKYMATHKCGDISPASSLEEIATGLEPAAADQAVDSVHVLHDKYNDEDHFHEAGFDSLLTAQVAVRLSRKLVKSGAYLEDLEEELGGVSIGDGTKTATEKSTTVLGSALSMLGLVKGNDKSNSNPSVIDGEAASEFTTVSSKRSRKAAKNNKNSVLNKEVVPDQDPKVDTAQDTLPAFDDSFWKVYGNRLRIFGTEETVLHLDAA